MTPQPTSHPAAHNLYTTLAQRAAATPSKPFLITPERGTWTYDEAFGLAEHLSAVLEQIGVRRGDRVAVQVDKSPEAVALYLACLHAGAVFLPLNTAYKRSELAFFIQDAEPRLVVGAPERAELLRGIVAEHPATRLETLDAAGGGSLLEEAAAGIGPAPATAAVHPDDPASILYTSGTTGRPKGAVLSHRNLSANALALEAAWGWRHDDVLIHALPIFHVHGLFVALHCAMLGASTIHFLPRFDAGQIVALLPEATVLMGVPTFYTRLLQHEGLTAEQCRTMRLFVAGSAPLQEQTFEAWRARTGHAILERYGMTETGMNLSNPLDGERRPGTVGRPLPGVRARIVDDTGHEVPPGTPGSLQIRGPNVFNGYWRLPEKTREEFTDDGFFITGDMAQVSKDGYYAIIGREKDLIISGGYNVYPKEVENELDAMDEVQESAVVGLDHPDLGEAVTAFIVPADANRPPAGETLIQRLKAELAGYKVPKQVHVVDELPRNTMGKVQKNVLREQHSA
ncbi:AMP-binding protein [Halorhodospira halophila]|uniref:AMP-binding protein n=1 Tax=Halorhodospira halophila TaxID=1053 RepID=UPI0019135E37|nr:AMP-binding protein [Halorhodospira halophila]MBK5942642.1 malonyl-CoA synthase [Halorhodospira halophila]